MAFLLWTWACDQLKPTTGQRMTLKNTSPQWVVHLSPRYSQVPLVSGYLFDSFQLTVTWMSTIKLNTDCICLGHLASNARSLHENSKSERAYYWSHIINTDIELDSLSGQSSLIMYSTFTVKRHESCSIGINCLNHLRSQQNVYFSRFCSHIEVTTRWKLNSVLVRDN